MTNTSALLAALAAAGVASHAHAGGFSRGTADTAILYEEGDFNMRSGVTIVAPQRDFDTIDVDGIGPGGLVTATDDVHTDSYVIPSYAVKFGIGTRAACAGTYTDSYGAGASYGPQAIAAGRNADGTGTIEEGFTSGEFGLTCGYNLAFENGHRLWFLGGAFLEDFQYSQTVSLADQATLGAIGSPLAPFGGAAAGDVNATLSFDGEYEAGFRAGVAYEIPKIAFRAELLYRSEINHNPSGTFAFDGSALPLTSFGTIGTGTLPQSVELRLQSGVAPNTLAFLNTKWTDWSVLDTLNYDINFTPLGAPIVSTQLDYFYRDGWTITGGLGREFTDNLSGLVSLTWDRGVSTTEDQFFDTYTLAFGGALEDQWGGQLRAGLGLSYLTGGEVAGNPITGQPGNSFAYTVDDDYSVAGSVSYSIRW